MLFVHAQGHLIDGRLVEALDYRLGSHVAELAHLAEHGGRNLLLGAEHEDVGLDSDALQLLDGVLCRLGLQFLGGMQVWHVGEVDEECAPAEFPLELAHRLKEGGRLDVADGASNFGNDEIIVAGLAEQLDVPFDLVGDMGDNLDCLAEIVATALLVDDRLVDSACGYVVGTRGLDVCEPFVVPEVQIGLMSVDGDVALAMLVGIECARVDVDVRVKFLDCHAVTAAEQQSRERARDDSLAERGDHSSGHKDVLSIHFINILTVFVGLDCGIRAHRARFRFWARQNKPSANLLRIR